MIQYCLKLFTQDDYLFSAGARIQPQQPLGVSRTDQRKLFVRKRELREHAVDIGGIPFSQQVYVHVSICLLIYKLRTWWKTLRPNISKIVQILHMLEIMRC